MRTMYLSNLTLTHAFGEQAIYDICPLNAEGYEKVLVFSEAEYQTKLKEAYEAGQGNIYQGTKMSFEDWASQPIQKQR